MRKQVEQWMAVHAVLLLISTVLFLFFDSIEYVALIALSTFSALYVIKARRDGLYFIRQAANLVTTFRWLLLALTLLMHDRCSNKWIVLVGLTVLLGDWLDGWLARRDGSESVFGEYLDMETDAFFVLVLSCILYERELAGWWILPIGLLRYAYFLVIRFLKLPEQKEERTFIARLIAVILMSSLVAGFILPPWLSKPLLILATILVLFSFARSFWIVLKYNLQQ